MNNKLLSLLGIAKKAGRIVCGYEKALESIHKHKAYIVFTASDLSEKTERGLIYACEEMDTKVKRLGVSMFELSNAVGQKTGIVSVNDKGFAKRLIELNAEIEANEKVE